MTPLSDHFSLEEATISGTAARLGIDNTPTAVQQNVMFRAAIKLEKVRSLLGDTPLHIDSWYRSQKLNAAVGGVPSSQHTYGEAIDFICPFFGTPASICKKIVENQDLIGYDQLILEHTWVHISFAILSGKPRGQVLSLLSGGGYVVGLTDAKGVQL